MTGSPTTGEHPTTSQTTDLAPVYFKPVLDVNHPNRFSGSVVSRHPERRYSPCFTGHLFDFGFGTTKTKSSGLTLLNIRSAVPGVITGWQKCGWMGTGNPSTRRGAVAPWRGLGDAWCAHGVSSAAQHRGHADRVGSPDNLLYTHLKGCQRSLPSTAFHEYVISCVGNR